MTIAVQPRPQRPAFFEPFSRDHTSPHPERPNRRYQERSSTEFDHPLVDVAPFWHDGAVPRFLTLADVAETLNVSASQAYALVRTGELPAIKVGGRGQWRIESTVLEEFIERMYSDTRQQIAAGTLGDPEHEDHSASS